MFYESLEKLQNNDTILNFKWIHSHTPHKFIMNSSFIEIVNCRVYLNFLNKEHTVMKSVFIGLSTIRDGVWKFKDTTFDVTEKIRKSITKSSNIIVNVEIQETEDLVCFLKMIIKNRKGHTISELNFNLEKIVRINKTLNAFKYTDYFFLPKKHIEWLKPLVKEYLVGFKLYESECWFDILSHPSVPNNLIIQMNDVDLHCEKPTEVIVEGNLLKYVISRFRPGGMPVIQIEVSENKPLILSDEDKCKWFIAPKYMNEGHYGFRKKSFQK